jgi:hypothetical protein
MPAGVMTPGFSRPPSGSKSVRSVLLAPIRSVEPLGARVLKIRTAAALLALRV